MSAEDAGRSRECWNRQKHQRHEMRWVREIVSGVCMLLAVSNKSTSFARVLKASSSALWLLVAAYVLSAESSPSWRFLNSIGKKTRYGH